MQQIFQNLTNGVVDVTGVPSPALVTGHLLVQTRVSLISAGTERMLLDFGKANWIEKARSQPDKVHAVMEKIRTDGLGETIESVRTKLDQPVKLGYSNVGIVLDAGKDVPFKSGDRIVSNGNHAEIICVPKTLCARLPESVDEESAAFTVIGSVALEGIRLVQPTLGEYVVVTGLGLVGLMTVQLLRANGCQVLGIDFDAYRLKLAEKFGASTVNITVEDPVSAAERFSHGRGVDAVLITAATKSNEPVHQAALMCRKRGRIVLVGVAGLQLCRDDFYKKELSFQVSCSYGPGRYDHSFESGHDYPYPYVRWTAQRNFEAVLELLGNGRLNIDPLITHRFPFEQAKQAYGLIQGAEPHLGVLLEFRGEVNKASSDLLARTIHLASPQDRPAAAPNIAFIGAGNYAHKTLIPAFKGCGAGLETIASNGGVSAAYIGRKFGFRNATTDVAAVFCDASIDTVAIATRHNSHARYVRDAILAGKNVFVEKPLALTAQEIDEIERDYMAAADSGCVPKLMIGFNRRFAPHTYKMKSLLADIKEPKAIVITVNAGRVSTDHWTQDLQEGGGRIIGEACHFVDLLRFLVGARVDSEPSSHAVNRNSAGTDILTFSLSFVDGSIGTVHYFASGHKRFPKERVEVFCGGRILQLDNYRTLLGWGWPRFRKMRLWRQDKGSRNMVRAFLDSIREGTPSPIPFDEIIEVSRTTLQIAVA